MIIWFYVTESETTKESFTQDLVQQKHFVKSTFDTLDILSTKEVGLA